jgi:membrane-bound ClpP family serine protease
MIDGAAVVGIILVIGGIALTLFEFLHPGAFLLVPGAVMIVVGIILVVGGSLLSQNPTASALALIGVGFAGAALTIPIYRKLAPTHPPMATTVDTLVNTPAKVIVAVTPGTMKGKVRVRGEIWSATSDAPIPVGADVMVVGGEGIILKVSPAPPVASPGGI